MRNAVCKDEVVGKQVGRQQLRVPHASSLQYNAPLFYLRMQCCASRTRTAPDGTMNTSVVQYSGYRTRQGGDTVERNGNRTAADMGECLSRSGT